MDQGGTDKSLENLRVEIDGVDSRLLELLNARAELVHQVGEIKKVEGLEIYAPEREEKLLQSLLERSEGRLPEKSIRAIYREIMSAALALEEHLKIAYLGPQGSWTHQAAREKFGASVDYVAWETLEDVFEQVAGRRADYGLIPIDNSSAADEDLSLLDCFLNSSLHICARVSLFGEEDESDIARFLVLGHNTCPATGRDLTVLLLVDESEEASSESQAALEKLAISANRIEGVRSGESSGAVAVILELEGHPSDSKVEQAIDKLDHPARTVKVLGSYPVGRR